MTNFVKIVAVSEERTDKNGRIFKLITVSSATNKEVTDPATGEIFFAVGKPKKTTIVAYQKSYLDDAPHYLYDLPVGTRVNGNIVTKTVEPYTIDTANGPKELTRYTTFVEAEVEDFDYDEIVEKIFENAGHTIVAKAHAEKVVPVVSQEDAFEDSEEEAQQPEAENKVPVMSNDDSEDFEDEF